MDHPAVELKDRAKKFALRDWVVSGYGQARPLRPITEQCVERAHVRNSSPNSPLLIEEADEPAVGLEFLVDSGLVPESRLKELGSKANQRVAMFHVSRTTAKKGVYVTINTHNSTIPQSRLS